jgi:SAM-dependent methyltransferase
MEFLSEEFWNERYLAGQTGWDMGAASPPLTAYIDQLKDPDIRILIPGCGNAHEASYLLERGFRNITAIDIAEIPFLRMQTQLKKYAGHSIEIIHGDFFQFPFQKPFDLILEQTFFCAISRSLRTSYAERVYELLAEKGKLVGVLFKTEFEQPGPPFGGSLEEYTALFSKKFKIHKLADCYNSHPKRMGNELFISLEKI